MSTDLGENLLDPGATPHENAQFLVFCVATIRAVAKYPELLRVSVCGANNDHRLGANEAPPAIISIFLGDQLQDVIDQLEQGGAKSTKMGGFMEIGVSVLPKLPKDAGDRNRTSPFAFTGNRFEFRAVGSSQSVAGPNTVLNTIVAESLDFIATQLEAGVAGGKTLNQAIQDLVPGIIKESKKVLFNGDGYSAEWHAEAASRGLPNLKTTVDALPAIIRKDSIDVFGKYKVYSERELHSRYAILCEHYIKTINVEGRTSLMMAKTMILPAALRYQGELATIFAAAKNVGVDIGSQTELLSKLSGLIVELQSAIHTLEHAVDHHAEGDLLEHTKHSRDGILAATVGVRAAADKLEAIVADDLWPIPTYREMLFIK